MTLPLSGNFSVSTATYSWGRSLTMRFFSRPIRKPSPFFLRNLRFSTPEYQLSALTTAGRNPQPSTSSTISRNSSFLVLPSALSTRRKLTGRPTPLGSVVPQSPPAGAFRRTAVLATPEVAHQLGLAFLAIGLVQHG